ncbi:MAG: hypothetical protein AMS15_03060 [Planctomycetes bacterium DG_23]|nr:MAG: hypothetical protein AMS15_03060 [Planctomycetes bacterium DG_23]
MLLIFLIFLFFLPIARPYGHILTSAPVRVALSLDPEGSRDENPEGQGSEAPTRRPAARPRTGRPESVSGEVDQERLREATASLLQLLLVTALLLLFVFVFVVLLILSRRRRMAGRKRPEPTVLEDLWTITEEEKD